MRLLAGERLIIRNDQYIKVDSGRLEIYAVTKTKAPFRQLFLLEVRAGENAYPAMDEFEQINLSAYAVSDAEIRLESLDEAAAQNDQELIRHWFLQLSELSWVRALIDRGDDMLQLWRNGSLFLGKQDKAAIWEEFLTHESIFSMLIGTRFQ